MANLAQMAKNRHAPRRMAILVKMAILSKMANLVQLAKNRQRDTDIQNVANIQIGCQKLPLQII